MTHNLVFCSYFDLISHTRTHTHTHTHTHTRTHTHAHKLMHKDKQHTQGPIAWHTNINIYINTTYYKLTKAICITLNVSFTDIKNLLSTRSFLFKYYSLVEVIYLLIAVRLNSSCSNTQNTKTKDSEKDNPGKGS